MAFAAIVTLMFATTVHGQAKAQTAAELPADFEYARNLAATNDGSEIVYITKQKGSWSDVSEYRAYIGAPGDLKMHTISRLRFSHRTDMFRFSDERFVLLREGYSYNAPTISVLGQDYPLEPVPLVQKPKMFEAVGGATPMYLFKATNADRFVYVEAGSTHPMAAIRAWVGDASGVHEFLAEKTEINALKVTLHGPNESAIVIPLIKPMNKDQRRADSPAKLRAVLTTTKVMTLLWLSYENLHGFRIDVDHPAHPLPGTAKNGPAFWQGRPLARLEVDWNIRRANAYKQSIGKTPFYFGGRGDCADELKVEYIEDDSPKLQRGYN